MPVMPSIGPPQKKKPQNAVYQRQPGDYAGEGPEVPIRTGGEVAPRRPRPGLADVAGAVPAPVKQYSENLWTPAELGQHILVAKESTELDTLRRKEYEAYTALEAKLATTQDPKQHEAWYKQYQTEVAGLGSIRPNVNRLFRDELENKIAPQRNATFRAGEQQHAIKLVKQDFDVNLEAEHEKGNLEGVAVLAYKGEQLGFYGPATTAKIIADAPAKIALTAAEKKVSLGDVSVVKDIEVQNTEGWSPENLEARRKLLNAAKQDVAKQGVDAANEISDAEAKLHGQNLGPAQFHQEVEVIKKKILDDPRLTGTEREVQLRQHEAWVNRFDVAARREVEAAHLDLTNKYDAMVFDIYRTASPSNREAMASVFKIIVSKDTKLSADEKLAYSQKADVQAAAPDAIDRDAVNALTREVDEFEQSHVGGPALTAKVGNMIRDGKFGTNNPHGNTLSQTLLRRIDKGEAHSARAQIDEARKLLGTPSEVDGDKLFMFNEATNAWLAAHPDATPEQAWLYGKQKARDLKALEVPDPVSGWAKFWGYGDSALTAEQKRLKALQEGKVSEGAAAIPAVKDRVVGQTYTINGKLYEWQLKGWVKK